MPASGWFFVLSGIKYGAYMSLFSHVAATVHVDDKRQIACQIRDS